MSESDGINKMLHRKWNDFILQTQKITMRVFCDSHCHPSNSKFDSVLCRVIQEAKSSGLQYVIGVAEGCTNCDYGSM